jgi:hypothetical protein
MEKRHNLWRRQSLNSKERHPSSRSLFTIDVSLNLCPCCRIFSRHWPKVCKPLNFRFHPDIIGYTVTKCLFLWLFEATLIKFGFYILGTKDVTFVDLLCFSGYKFIGYFILINFKTCPDWDCVFNTWRIAELHGFHYHQHYDEHFHYEIPQKIHIEQEYHCWPRWIPRISKINPIDDQWCEPNSYQLVPRILLTSFT